MNKSVSMSTKDLITISLLIAVEIVLTRFLSISTPIVRIGFGFLPVAAVAILYGPLYAGAAAAIGDLLGANLFPIGAYFPGFTLTAFLTGLVYGIFLYRQPKNLLRIGAAVLVIALVLQLGLDTVWVWMITGKGLIALLPARLLKAAVIIPVQISAIYFLYELLVHTRLHREIK